MAWSGELVLVTPIEVRRTLKVIADEPGFVISCSCGASRWCTGIHRAEDSESFGRLHAGHRRKG